MLAYLEQQNALSQEELGDFVSLRYFGSRGRAEQIRLLFAELRIQYEDIAYVGDQWVHAKKEGLAAGTLPFGQLPVVTIGADFHIAQAQAIMMFFGRKHGLYSGDEATLARIDMVMGGCEDMRKR